MSHIYILQLEGGNYYVGCSDNVLQRYQQHLNGEGSAWTQKYAPISLIETYHASSPFDEDKVTKEYMAKYGIDHVRGGSYVTLSLTKEQRTCLELEIWAAKGLCTQCGKSGHFIKDCPVKQPYQRSSYPRKSYSQSSYSYYNDTDSSESESESDY